MSNLEKKRPHSNEATHNGNKVKLFLLRVFKKYNYLLSSAGRCELPLHQRGCVDQGFHKIPTPHAPCRMKELASQATIYIRPLQIDIERLESTENHIPKYFLLVFTSSVKKNKKTRNDISINRVATKSSTLVFMLYK